ncbi:MAG: hypothetical protein ACT4PT_09845 [Methanobacteriota archaeon]
MPRLRASGSKPTLMIARVGPAYARHVVPNAGDPKGFVEIGIWIGIEVVVGGQKVRTGDWVVGDESGLVEGRRAAVVEMAPGARREGARRPILVP